MITIRKIASAHLRVEGLDDKIIAFDKQNMGPILALKGIPFPEEKRRKGFASDATFHIALDAVGRVVGYVEYGPDWNDADAIYIASLQIQPSYRHTMVFRRLLAGAINDLRSKSFTRITAGVQKHNENAIKLYRRLGFVILEEKASATSYPVQAGRNVLETAFAKRLSRMPQ